MSTSEAFIIPDDRTKHLTYSTDTKIVVMSDMHRGDGTGSDDFAHNSLIFKCALDFYLDKGFTYIELGDAEELWENKAFDQIYITHTSIYDKLKGFHDSNTDRTRYVKIWGNHDLDWKDDQPRLKRLFRDIEVYECVLLDGPKRILLLHGHQFDPTCHGTGGQFSKFVVRHLWQRLQRCGFRDPTRAANNPGKSNEVDNRLYNWAKENDQGVDVVIAGHTHRPVYENLTLTERRLKESNIGTPGIKQKLGPDPVYYNTGSCVHPRCITGIEITFENQEPEFRLIKWAFHANAGSKLDVSKPPDEYNLAVKRSVLEQRKA